MTESDYTETLINMIRESLENIEINENDLIRKIKVYKSNYILHFDDIESVNYDITTDCIEFNEPIMNLLEVYNELNILELNKLINTLKFNVISTYVIKPLK